MGSTHHALASVVADDAAPVPVVALLHGDELPVGEHGQVVIRQRARVVRAVREREGGMRERRREPLCSFSRRSTLTSFALADHGTSPHPRLCRSPNRL